MMEPPTPSRDIHADAAETEGLVAFLNELLEAERAGAKVTLKSAQTADAGPIVELLTIIQRDEARWCAMLQRQIRALGGVPSSKVGAFYDKAMAIADMGDRITFLNRGQAWVVKKLREMLPRVGSGPLATELAEMLASHEANITLANQSRPGER
jgi:nitronate monooxygenase